LTAAADPGSRLISWTGCTTSSGNTCTVTMNANKKVTANFGPDLVGTWAVSGNETVTGSAPGYSETVTGYGSDEVTFYADGTFQMTDWQGTWTQQGNAFTVYVSPGDIEYYFELYLASEFGVAVNVTVKQLTCTGIYNWSDDNISGTLTMSMNFTVPGYGVSGTVTAQYPFTGTEQQTFQAVSVAKAGPSRSLLKMIGEEIRSALMLQNSP
jgi:hypothetical protein